MSGRTKTVFIAVAILLFISIAGHPSGTPIQDDRTGAEDGELQRIRKMIGERGYRWTAGITSLSRLPEDERLKLLRPLPPVTEPSLAGRLVGKRVSPFISCNQSYRYDADAARFDWRELGAVTPVKNQGGCGSCWAFAATGQLESHIRIYDGVTLDLSEQHVIDCNDNGYDCDGGWHWSAYDLFIDEGAVAETCIPYEETDTSSCRIDLCPTLALLDDYRSVYNNVSSIKEALMQGPVATGISVPCEFFYYKSGIFEASYPSAINHVVLITGWDDMLNGGAGAWICKNSWGSDWGDEGYFYVGYGDCEIGSYCRQIEYAPSLVMESPLPGETIPAGSTVEIAWSIAGPPVDSFNISLSLDGGDSFDHTIAAGLTGPGPVEWQPPYSPSQRAVIRIESYLGGGVRAVAMNSFPFSIVVPDILEYSFPNPFNGETTISYSISIEGPVRIGIYDLKGRLLRVLVNGTRPIGRSTVNWDGKDIHGRNVSSGIYFCRIDSGNFRDAKKLVYIR